MKYYRSMSPFSRQLKPNCSYLTTTLIIAFAFLLSACSNNRQWVNPKKTLADFHIDEKTCQAMALKKAQDASLVAQPIPSVYQTSFADCMQAMGWSTQHTNSAVTSVAIIPKQSGTHLELHVGNRVFSIPGAYTSLKKINPGISMQSPDGTFAHVIFQESNGNFQHIIPPINSSAVLFDSRATINSVSNFFYQYVKDRLIFASTSYIFCDKKNRLIITFSHDMGKAPADFINLPQEKFTRLTEYQHHWENMINTVAGNVQHQ